MFLYLYIEVFVELYKFNNCRIN